MADLTGLLGSQRAALTTVGLSRGSWQNRQAPPPYVSAPIHQADRAYESRISQEDRSRIGDLILAGWAGGNSMSHSYAAAWDQGMYLASQRSWWRIAAEIEDQMLRPQTPKKSSKRSPRQVPVLKPKGPGQA